MEGATTAIRGSAVSRININGLPALEVARGDGEAGLSARDLAKRFGLYQREASYLYRKIAGVAEDSTGRVFVRFGQVRKHVAGGMCVNDTRYRPAYPDETCLAMDVNTLREEEAIGELFQGWSAGNREVVREWYANVTSLTDPRTAIVTFDHDDTIVPDSIGPKVIEVGVAMGLIKFDEKIPITVQLIDAAYVKTKFGLTESELDALVAGTLSPEILTSKGIKMETKGIKTPYDWWKFLAENTFGAIDADYLVVAFGGLTVGEVGRIVEETGRRYPALFRAYPEMTTMINDMNSRGMCTAVVSSSNFIEAAYALHEAGVNVPLYAIQGTDFYVIHPQTSRHVLFSDLVNTEYLPANPNATIKDVLAYYKDVKILPLPDQIQNGGEGKGASADSIADRHAMYQTMKNPEKPVFRGDMRLVGHFGDSNATRSDLPGLNPEQGGNDQGLLRAVIPGQYFALVNIDRGDGTQEGDGVIRVSYKKKGKKIDEYFDMVEDFIRSQFGTQVVVDANTIGGLRTIPQLRYFYPVHQGAISRGAGMGVFDK